MTRVDVHRPSAIEPADYEFVGFQYLKVEDIGDAEFLRSERERIRRHMERTGGTYSSHAHGGNCHICGAHCVYIAIHFHKPTNAYVKTGLECAEKLDCGNADRFRKSVRTALEQVAGKRKAKALLEANGLAAAWTIYTAENRDGFKRDEQTVCDIVGRLVQYGQLSEKQIGFLGSLCQRIANRPELEAAWKAEAEAAAPVPVTAERIQLRGQIVGFKAADLENGFPARLILKAEAGFKVMGTVPKSIADAQKGDTVEFFATVKPSAHDPKFGYFSRPTKAEIVKAGEA